MTNIMKEIMKGKKTTAHALRLAGQSHHHGSSVSQESQPARGFARRKTTIHAQPSTSAATSNQPGSGSSSSPDLSRPNLREWTQTAFQSLKGTLSEWFIGRKGRSHDVSLTESDLERQSEQESYVNNVSSNNGNQQTPRGSTEDRDMEASRKNNEPAPLSEKSLPASLQASVEVQRSTDTARRKTSSVDLGHFELRDEPEMTADLANYEVDEEERSNNSDNEPTRGVDFDQTFQRSQHASTMPRPRRTKRRRILQPSGNLNEHLIRGYYQPGTLSYQPRRTLDQYGHADIETTSHRDDDQVVYRYTKDDPTTEIKIFMVDQLWLWVLGKGLSSIIYTQLEGDSSLKNDSSQDTIVTCSPLRWDSWVPKGVRPRTPSMDMPRSTFLEWLGGHNAAWRPYPKTHPDMMVIGEQRSKKKHKSGHRHGRRQAYARPGINQDDPLSVPQRVTRHLLKQGRGVLGSVHDLAGLITTCCVDVFDPHQIPDEFLFFDFFERSIGIVVRRFHYQVFINHSTVS